MCPRALLVVANFDGIVGEWSRFKNWTILFLVYVGENFQKDRLRHFPIEIFTPIRSKFLRRSKFWRRSDRTFCANDTQPANHQ